MRVSAKITSWGLIHLTQWLQNQRGATAIEYALIAGGIGGAVLSATLLMGNSIENILDVVGTSILGVQNSVATS